MAGASRTKTRRHATNLRGDVFAFIAGAIGFVVDVVGLIGIISGFVTLPTGSFFKHNPFALAVLTLCSVVYSVLLLLYFIRRKVHRRWLSQSTFLSEAADETWMLIAAYLLWVPIFLIWAIAIWTVGADAGYKAPILAVVFVLFCFFARAAGGRYLCETVCYFDMALNPGEGLTIENARKWNSSSKQKAR
jgi:hypothetical protein